jgi:outer membrane biosynthesis protein TonB
MTKSKSTKKAATPKAQTAPKAKKIEKPAKAAPERIVQEAPKKERFADLCVFAFRLTEAERDLIHKAAGPAKASKFVRSLAVAAARNDEAAVKAILKAVQSEA